MYTALSVVERERSFHGHMEDVEALGSRLRLRYVALILPALRRERGVIFVEKN